MSRPFALCDEAIEEVRQWRAVPKRERKITRAGLALRLRVSENTISRAANRRRSYAKV